MTTQKRICKLIMVTDPSSDIATANSGNNKVYNLTDNENGTFTAEYGRVGGHMSTKIYPISKWQSTINSKLRKGYHDVTPLKVEKNITFVGVHPEVLSLLNLLQRYAGQHIQNTYIGTAADITYQQVQDALNFLTIASNVYETNPEEANKQLIQVYSMIPRQMANVGDYLIKGDSEQDFQLIQNEMSNLQALSQQVKMQDGDISEVNPLEQMRLEIEPISTLPVSDHPKFSAAFKVINRTTQNQYDLINLDNEKLLWHGTKKAPGFSIFQNGLDIKYAARGLFGRGLYTSDNWRKAQQYSQGFYFLQNVKLGKMYEARRQQNSNLHNEILSKGFNSCFGITQYNEFIIYKNEQTTVGYFLIVD